MKEREEKAVRMLRAFGRIREETILEADEPLAGKKRKRGGHIKGWLRAAAAVLVFAILVSAFSLARANAYRAYAISQAEYPKAVKYSEQNRTARGKWAQDREKKANQPEGYADGLEAFYRETMQEFLGGSSEQNKVYSPLSLYIALGMLAELTDGESRAQVLEVLDAQDPETLRQKAHSLWEANYCDDGILTCLLSSSVWLDRDILFRKETMSRLSEVYYASSYHGKMGSEGFNRALRSWVDQHTRGLLKGEANNLAMSPDTVFALASTVYFDGKWSLEFQKSETRPRTFYRADGETVCQFMHKSCSDTYYWGERFGAVRSSFKTGAGILFLLPDEGVSAEELLLDEEAFRFLTCREPWQDWEKQKYLEIRYYVPRFEVKCQLDLSEGLQKMGMTDVFDRTKADFTPMLVPFGDGTAQKNVALSAASQSTFVKLDEDGVKAAAFTFLAGAGSSAPPEDVMDFVLDRPFLFCIVGLDGSPLFIGIVNDPNG